MGPLADEGERLAGGRARLERDRGVVDEVAGVAAGTVVDFAVDTVAAVLGEAVAVFGKQTSSTYIPHTSSLAKNDITRLSYIQDWRHCSWV